MAFERGEQVLFESFFKIFFTQFLPLLLYTFFQKQTFVKTCIPTQTRFAAKPLEIFRRKLYAESYRPPERDDTLNTKIRLQLFEI